MASVMQVWASLLRLLTVTGRQLEAMPVWLALMIVGGLNTYLWVWHWPG